MGLTNQPPDLLPGTLDMLILRTLLRGELHGYGIAERLRQVSEDVLHVGESSLYPALQRLLLNGWVKAEWGTSENNRRARYYTLTAAGRKRLGDERREFDRLIGAIQRVSKRVDGRPTDFRLRQHRRTAGLGTGFTSSKESTAD